jgi:hypothetical protein
VVPRAHAPRVRRRAGRGFREPWETARGVHDRSALRGEARPGALVRRREDAARKETCAALAAKAFDRAAIDLKRAVWRARHVALGRAHMGGERSPAVRLLPGDEAALQRHAGDRGRRYSINVGAYTSATRSAVRQPPLGQPARDLRPGGPRPLALHAVDRAVGQRALAVVLEPRGTVGEGGVHQPSPRARDKIAAPTS